MPKGKERDAILSGKLYKLSDAISKFVHSGDHIATGGFTTSRKPMAAMNEIIRQGQTDFIVEAGPAGSDWDMMIGAGRVKAYINCYTANPRFSNVSRRFRAAIEEGKLLFEDYSQDAAMMMFHGAALGLSCVPVRMMLGSGMEKEWGISAQQRRRIDKLPNEKFIIQDDPFHPGEKMLLLPTPRLDTAIIHVQMASPDGTCRIYGDPYQDVDLAIAARNTIVTCEELVSNEYIRREPDRNTIPGIAVSAVVHVPYGGHPSQVYGMYDYDKEFYLDYDQAGRTDESFQRFLKEWVYGTKDHEDYLNRLGVTRLTDLKVVPGIGYHISDEDVAEGETI
jgi:glutaconate CoA-transferase subunit A